MASPRLGTRKKRALQKRWTIWFLDESGASLTPLVGKTWSPKGHVPTLRHNFGNRDKVSMISAVGSRKKLHFQLKVGESIKQGDVVRFLKHLLRHVRGRLVVFLDGAQQHKGIQVQEFRDEHRERILVLPLPPYGFDYNPDEGVWSHLKWAQLKNFTPHDTKELVAGIRTGLRKIARRPLLVASFWRECKLPEGDVEWLLKQSGNL